MPKPVHLIQSLAQPSAHKTSLIVSTGDSAFCNSYNVIGGELVGNYSRYDDINDWAYGYSSSPKFRPDSVNLELIGIHGDKIGTMLQSFRHGVIGANWNLEPADCVSVGLCLDATITTTQKLNIRERQSIRVYLDDKPVFVGRVRNRAIINRHKDEHKSYTYNLEGWKAFASDVLVIEGTYKGVELSDIVRELAQRLSERTPVIYNATKVDAVGYSVEEFKTRGYIKEALDSLTQLAGDWSWGVDVHGEFYFRAKTVNVLHHFWQDTNPIKVSKFEYNTSEIRNHLKLVYKPENAPEQTRIIKDSASIAQYLEIQKILPVDSTPFTINSLNPADRTISSNKPINNLANIDDSDPYNFANIDPVAIGDYIQIDINNSSNDTAVNAIEIDQGSYFYKRSGYIARGEVQRLQVVALPSLDIVCEHSQPTGGLYLLPFDDERVGDSGYRVIAKELPIELVDDWINARQLSISMAVENLTSAAAATQATMEFTPHYDMRLNSIVWWVIDTAAAPNDNHSIEINGTTVTVNTAGKSDEYEFDFGGMNLTAGTTYTITFTRDLNAAWRIGALENSDGHEYSFGAGAVIGGNTEDYQPMVSQINVDINVGKSYGWEIRAIGIPVSAANDATRYAEKYLEGNAWPYIEGSFELEPGYFYQPAAIRFTDINGETHDRLYIDKYSYSLDKGLKTSVEIGNRKLYLEQLIVAQGRKK